MAPHFVITGLPRSGTTLAAALADQLDGVVCVNEPPRYYRFTRGADGPQRFVEAVANDLSQMAASIRRGDGVQDLRLPDGRYPTNYFGEDGRRLPLVPMMVHRDTVDERLVVGVKHNEPLTAVLPDLARQPGLRVFAVVRQPIPAILSWRAARIPLSSGLLSPGYRLWPEAHEIRRSSRTLLEFHARIYDMYCTRYLHERDHITLLRYEDIVEDGSVVGVAFGRRFVASVPELMTENHKRLAGRDAEIAAVAEAVRQHCRTVGEIYPDADTFTARA